MAVAFDATFESGTHDSSSSVSIAAGSTLTVSSGAVLIFFFALGRNGLTTGSVSSCKWNTSESLSLISGAIGTVIDNGGNRCMDCELWGITNPTAGNKQFDATFSTTIDNVYVGAISYTGASSFAHGANANGTSTQGRVTVISATGNATFAIAAAMGSDWSSNVNTNVFSDNHGGFSSCWGDRAAGSASVTLGANNPASIVWQCVGADIVASGGGASVTQSIIEVRQSLKRASYW